MEGKQKLFYLPEPHTDFIFAVTAEELGLVGAMFVVTLFAIFLWRGMRACRPVERSGCYRDLLTGAYLFPWTLASPSLKTARGESSIPPKAWLPTQFVAFCRITKVLCGSACAGWAFNAG